MMDMKGWFRWTDGWYFKRAENGSVEIMHLVSEDPHLGHDVRISIPPHEWCSILTAVASGDEEDSARFAAACALHGVRNPAGGT